MRDRGMEAYYCQRAPEYDSFYSVPERQEELAWLAGWMREHCCGRHVLEIAAGTGHWTRIAAESAATVTATDVSKEMLAIAAARTPAKHVRFVLADAYALPRMDQTFEVGMAHLWWSHVPRQSRIAFLRQVADRLRPDATLLLMDQNFVPGLSSPTFRTDSHGNQLAVRTLADGRSFEVVKNYPDDAELAADFATFCSNMHIVRRIHFWALTAQLRSV